MALLHFSSLVVCYIFGYVNLLATCLTRAQQGLVNTWFCLMPDQFLFFMIFALGSAPLRFHPSLSSPSVKIVFSCQTCPGYSPIQCLRESLFSFLDFCLFVCFSTEVLCKTIGFNQLSSCLLFYPVLEKKASVWLQPPHLDQPLSSLFKLDE